MNPLASLRNTLWTTGGLLLFGWILYLLFAWRKMKNDGQDPFLFVLKTILRHFRLPILLVSLSNLGIVFLGFFAGSQVSMILFVTISALTISALGFITWIIWPRDTAQSNLFDLLELPNVHWPIYENEADRLARKWVEEKALELKTIAPELKGNAFGDITLDISTKLTQIYQKQTMLSVSVTDLLAGIERTAADLKDLTNCLPLASQLTIADLERKIQFTKQQGKILYTSLLLILSLFNPGNLIRFAMIFIQKKSPWEHLLKELQGWIFGHFFLRLGYHMSLIYSERKPPPPDALQKECQTLKMNQISRIKKFSILGMLSLFGVGLYLILQITNATLVFGTNALLLDLGLLCGILCGAYTMRSPERWKHFYNELMPQWPDSPSPEGKKEQHARQAIQHVNQRYKDSPELTQLDQLRTIPSLYGQYIHDIWKACYQSYQHPQDNDPTRAAREIYLPQGFAGIEMLCKDLLDWYKSQTTLPTILRQFERFGFDLESLYLQFQKKQRPSSPQINQKKRPPDSSKKDEEDLSNSSSFWNHLINQFSDLMKDFAIHTMHKKTSHLIGVELAERFISIYGARFPLSHFEIKTTKQTNILFLARDLRSIDTLLTFLLQDQYQPSDPQDIQSDILRDQRLARPTLEANWTDHHSKEYRCYSQLWTPTFTGFEHTDPLSPTFQSHTFQSIVLLEPIDYGGRGQIARCVKERLIPQLRSHQSGDLAIVLFGVEKLKPLRWDPPYDDYLTPHPTKRKSQRIRNAILEWQKHLAEHHPISIERIFPIGIPSDQPPWGIPSLLQCLALEERINSKKAKISSPESNHSTK